MTSIIASLQCAIATGVLIFAFAQVTFKNSGSLNRCMAIAMASLAWILFYFWAVTLDLLDVLYVFTNTDIAMTFFSAAGIYLSFTTILREDESPPEHYARHFIAPTIITLATIGYNALRVLLTGRAPRLAAEANATPEGYVLSILSFASDVAFFSYTLAALLDGIRVWRRKAATAWSHFRAMFLFLCGIQLLAATFIASDFFRLTVSIVAGGYLCGLAVIVYSIIGFRYPEYTQRVLKTVSGKNKRRTALNAQGIETLMRSLVALMEQERAYRNPELTLDDVGARLGISASMVSQLINSKARVNFKSYINRYRIAEVCRQLVLRPERSILELAFENGFNSKSAFNAAFMESTGTTPSEYRKKQTAKG